LLDLKIPKGIGLFIIFYLLSTVLLYNGFFPMAVTSRLPLLLSLAIFFPVAVLHSKDKVSKDVLFWGAGFMLVCLLSESFHLLTNSGEFISILSILAILLFYSFIHLKSPDFLKNSLILALAAYILIFYFLAFANGMIGISSNPSGSFVYKYVPGLVNFMVSANFPSGRGAFGLVGGSLLILLFHTREMPMPIKIALYSLSVFALLISDSRGVILSLLFIVLLRILPLPNKQKVRLLFLVPIIIILVQPLFFVNIEYLLQQSVSVSRENQGTEARTEIWPICLVLIFSSAQSFLFGYGEAGSGEILQTFFKGGAEEFDAAHNLFLQLFLNGGLILFLSFLILLIQIWRRGRSMYQALPKESLCFIYLLIFMMTYGITASVIYFNRVNESMFLLIMALSGVYCSFKQAHSDSKIVAK
jgi:O-antigen ligase